MKSRFSLSSSLLIVLVLALGACAPAAPANPNLILATTTSTQDSELLDVLIPLFETESGYKVQTVAVGSGQAMKIGEEGNADVLLVHAPASEVIFMESGFGKNRALVMHNDFIIVGPVSDPASIKGKPVLDALKLISVGSGIFISRGDDSGTHKAELALWKKVKFDPKAAAPAWYLESGQGMVATMPTCNWKFWLKVTNHY